MVIARLLCIINHNLHINYQIMEVLNVMDNWCLLWIIDEDIVGTVVGGLLQLDDICEIVGSFLPITLPSLSSLDGMGNLGVLLICKPNEVGGSWEVFRFLLELWTFTNRVVPPPTPSLSLEDVALSFDDVVCGADVSFWLSSGTKSEWFD